MKKVTYKELLEKIAKKQGFDPIYSIKHLTIKECFYNKYIYHTEKNLKWDDMADIESIKETEEATK